MHGQFLKVKLMRSHGPKVNDDFKTTMIFRLYNKNDCRAFGFDYDETVSMFTQYLRFSHANKQTISVCWSNNSYTNNDYPSNGFTAFENEKDG